jgi:peptidoglycan hydrolase-like protein with peptidoglycan-binding domain
MRLSSELVELNLRPQDPAAFELPAGLSPMGVKGIFGSMFGQQGQAGAAAAPTAAAPTAAAAAAGGASVRPGPSSADLTTDNLTQSVQNHLQALGYSVGNTRGDPDTNTVIAISQFQAENGMEVTGEATPQLLGILGAKVDSR